MRSSYALALLTGLCFAFAASARAGDFSPPVDFNACGDMNVSGSAMHDPNFAYTNADTPERCAKLCDRAGALCRVYVKDVFACHVRVLANTKSFGKLNCENVFANPADAKACKQNVVDSIAFSIGLEKEERDEFLQGCDAWKATCRAACAGG